MKFLSVTLLALVSSIATAQPFPNRSITLVVPFSAGGPTDTIGRLLGEREGRTLGPTVVVETTTGAGGTIAMGPVARAAPDGYLFGIGHIGKTFFAVCCHHFQIVTICHGFISFLFQPLFQFPPIGAWVKAGDERCFAVIH